MTDDVAYPLFRRWSAGNPPFPPSLGGGGGGSGSMVAAGPSPIPSENLAGGSVTSVAGPGPPDATDFDLSFFTRGIPVSGGIRENG